MNSILACFFCYFLLNVAHISQGAEKRLRQWVLLLKKNRLLCGILHPMMPPSPNKSSDWSLVTAFLLVLVFVSPFTSLWSHGEMSWYAPYMIWLGIVILIAISSFTGHRDDGEA